MSHSTIESQLTTPADIGKEPNLNCIFMDFVTYSLSEKHIICFARHEWGFLHQQGNSQGASGKLRTSLPCHGFQF